MSTKGAGFRYGNTNQTATDHINYQWAKDFNSNTLKKHFDEHGSQMNTATMNDYAAKAVHFANTINREDCVSFIDGNGSTYKYNKETNELAIISKNGYVITYFSPKNGYTYYKNERIRKKR
ncbi:MAG: hypothetical protein Q4B60_05370 [Erysipelotrichaceae bacterium]|nr:hypothetical protein [Erysipelotrichaceae bacterium]